MTMPKKFTRCVANGGRVITKRVNKDQYMHICYLDGKAYPGEVLTKKDTKKTDKAKKK